MQEEERRQAKVFRLFLDVMTLVFRPSAGFGAGNWGHDDQKGSSAIMNISPVQGPTSVGSGEIGYATKIPSQEELLMRAHGEANAAVGLGYEVSRAYVRYVEVKKMELDRRQKMGPTEGFFSGLFRALGGKSEAELEAYRAWLRKRAQRRQKLHQACVYYTNATGAYSIQEAGCPPFLDREQYGEALAYTY